MRLNVLYEDKYIIVVEKPPKVPSQSDKTKDKDMLSLIKEYLIEKNKSSKEPYTAIVHRLDRPVGGIMVFAKTKSACSHLNKQIQNKQIKKTYYCTVCGEIEQKEGTLKDYLKRLKTINMSKAVDESTKGAKEAILQYRVLNSINDEEHGKLSLVKVNLVTGRHHQIRVQLSHHGYPLWGDTKYNKKFTKKKTWSQIALFAGELSFKHPKTNKIVQFQLNRPQTMPFILFD
ncbi:RNA pseudouridine synthase [Clostridiaceae bacterium M8S5]|nr:RNA pseudouridine synthase [Clostridiaceae bacterium M8S5]